MPTPPSITFKTVHGQILALDSSGTPAVGHVIFESPTAVRDTVDNMVFGPTTVDAVLSSTGEFTVSLAATDDTDLDPTGWMWRATVLTNVLVAVYFIPVAAAGPTPIEFADVVTTVAPPGFNTYTSSEVDALLALKVAKAGDTMTGDLNLSGTSTDLTVGGVLTGTYKGITGDVMQLLSTALSTGVTSGGEFNPNVDPTKLDITAMTGWIIDYYSSGPLSATNPKITFVSTPAQVGLIPSISNGILWWLVTSAGTIIQQTSKPSPTQRRTHIVLGATAHVAGTIVVDQTLPVIQSQPANQLVDLMDSLGPFSISGNRISPNGINLKLNKTAGSIFARAFSQIPTYGDPHTSALAAQTPATFRHITAVPGGAGALVTDLNVGSYDPGGAGVVTAIPGGANTSTNFRVWGFGTNLVQDQVLVQYGQVTYAALADAQAAVGTTNFIASPTAVGSGVLLGWISAIKSATDLSNVTQAVFTSATGKFPTP